MKTFLLRFSVQFYQVCRHTKHILFSKSVARVGNWQSSLWCIYDAMTVTSWLLPAWNKNTWLSRTWLKKYVFFFFSFNNNCPQFNCWIVLLSPTGAKHYTWLSWPQLKEYVFFSFKNNCPHFNCWIILHSPTAAKHYTWLSWPVWGRDISPSKA